MQRLWMDVQSQCDMQFSGIENLSPEYRWVWFIRGRWWWEFVASYSDLETCNWVTGTVHKDWGVWWIRAPLMGLGHWGRRSLPRVLFILPSCSESSDTYSIARNSKHVNFVIFCGSTTKGEIWHEEAIKKWNDTSCVSNVMVPVIVCMSAIPAHHLRYHNSATFLMSKHLEKNSPESFSMMWKKKYYLARWRWILCRLFFGYIHWSCNNDFERSPQSLAFNATVIIQKVDYVLAWVRGWTFSSLEGVGRCQMSNWAESCDLMWDLPPFIPQFNQFTA